MVADKNTSPWWSAARHADIKPFLAARNAVARAIRAWFDEQDFTEVETAVLQVSPGNETHLHAPRTDLAESDGGRATRYLRTSPEFACKKLLAAGETRIFEFARVFRDRERGRLHLPEFTMLEWYRANAAYDAVMADTVVLIAQAAHATGIGQFLFRGRTADPFAEPELLTVARAFERFAGIDLLATVDGAEGDRAKLAAAAGTRIRVASDDTWSDIFSKILVEYVEPNLGQGRLTLLYEYPLPEAALARVASSDPRVAERFEVYACGVELANGFGELTDAAEQRRRFTQAMDEKQRRYGERYPLDEEFLAAVAIMPEASGVALGFDRLVMLASGAASVDQVGVDAPNWRSMSSIIFKPVSTLREPAELAARGLVPVADIPSLEKVAARYAIAVTPEVAALIDPDDPLDPIARQYIPSLEELVAQPNEKPDPIGDETHSPVSGIVHRYPDRVLFKLVHVCAVYCRFCFRREMVGPGKGTTLSEGAYNNALAYIRAHSEIWEVILTGGDPLMLSPRRLSEVMADLARIDHVKVIRIHSRVPVAEPQRINDKMVAALRVKGATTWVAVHANHVRELTPNARAACAAMIDAGIPMVSQSVLLRGVNDDPESLEALMRGFVECRIKPYYLHHGDLAPGTSHLRTTLAHGQEIMRALRGRVSGLCQPDFVVDIPGGHGKAPAGPNYLSVEKSFSADREQSDETRYRIVDYCGDVHLYPPGP